MLQGIIIAIIAGILLGLYALPEKFTKGFQFENTWGLFFIINMLVVPLIGAAILVKGSGNIFSAIPSDILMKMVIGSFAWGIGVTMWGKAINHIGVSLGFSIFIGTVILIGSLLPFVVDGLPPNNVFMILLGGILVVLIGVMANGKAGMLRHAGQSVQEAGSEKSSMAKGILIAIIGGVLATGFSYANAVGRPAIHEASMAQGNAEWVSAVVVMCVIYISGGIIIASYFLWQLTSKKLWGNFKNPALGKNISLISVMAVFNFAASVLFAFSAFKLGSSGNTVGYAIFNTVCVAVAIISGILTGEWTKASPKAKNFLYIGLAAMIVGVIIIALGNAYGVG